jgi:hypothetical protein
MPGSITLPLVSANGSRLSCGRLLAGVALGLELGVDKVRGPCTLEPCALAKLALSPDTKALKKALRPKVACICPGEHSVHCELPKRVLHHGSNRLRGIPLTLMGWSEREPKLGLAGLRSTGTNGNVPNESPRRCETHRELKPGVRCPWREVL